MAARAVGTRWPRVVSAGWLAQRGGGAAVGGVKIDEPAADLAILLAIVSSLRGQPLPRKLVVFGEVGLAGEVRAVQRGQERLREAAKLGFASAIVPKANAPRGAAGKAFEGLTIHPVERIEEAIDLVRTL